MLAPRASLTLALGAALALASGTAGAQEPMHGGHGGMEPESPTHEMWMVPLSGGWHLLGMAHAYPIVTIGAPARDANALDETELYLTQPAAMLNVESPERRVVVRVTPNFEGLTIPDGELTFGGWGEGFLDKRHPHTLLHEAMLSVNFPDLGSDASASISAGKGFAPFGTDDPMSRPAVKYPTNHHLSQILERWTLNGIVRLGPWSLEAGLFGGAEPEGPYDFSNIESFGDSWSARVVRRFGPGAGPGAAWELSGSFGSVNESHGEHDARTRLFNAAVRHDRPYAWGELYGLVEGSVSDPENEDGYFSVLGEAQLTRRAHRPYARVEFATRPEYRREGPAGTDGFFRYDHDAHPIGATRWWIATVGYGYSLTGFPHSVRPFIEAGWHRVSEERGGIVPEALFGADRFWAMTAGFRVFLGGGPMRMGAYGVLDPMTAMHGDLHDMHGGAEHGQGEMMRHRR